MRNARTAGCPHDLHDPADRVSNPFREVKSSIDKVGELPPAPCKRSSRMFHGQRTLKLPQRPLSSLTVVPWSRVAGESSSSALPLPTPHRRLNPTTQVLQPRHSSLMQTLGQLHRISPEPPTCGGHSDEERKSQTGISNLEGLEANAAQPGFSKQPSYPKPQLRIFGYSFASLYDFWEKLQVSHCGHYSVERMLALDEYCRNTSLLRVLAVCVMLPLGPLLVIILTECLPLEPAEKGALANYVFWMRHTLMGTMLIACAMVQAKVWIPEISLSLVQVFAVAIGSASVYTCSNVLLAHLWVFPIPFLIVAGAPLLLSIMVVASRTRIRLKGSKMARSVVDGSCCCVL
jgi:hypothetical protein